jgi:hypothetical protein
MNLSFVSQSNFEATSILEKSELNLRYNLSQVDVDKSYNDYKVEYKSKFFENTFS